jgi:thiol:disulfide interchange protein DsbD
MKHRIVITFIFIAFISALKAQVKHSHWNLSTKKITNCEYDLIFTVTIDKGWHTFSVVKIKGVGQEVFSTEIILNPNPNYTIVGNLCETKPVSEYDPTIKKNVLLHYNKVVFTQRIKLNSGNKVKISGSYENQSCNDGTCEITPKHKFDFDLEGSTTCLK